MRWYFKGICVYFKKKKRTSNYEFLYTSVGNIQTNSLVNIYTSFTSVGQLIIYIALVPERPLYTVEHFKQIFLNLP